MFLESSMTEWLHSLLHLFKVHKGHCVPWQCHMLHISIKCRPIYYYLNCTGLSWLWIGNGRAERSRPQSQCFRHSSASVIQPDWDAAGCLPFSPTLAFCPCRSICSAWNRHSDERQRGPKTLWRKGACGTTHKHTHTCAWALLLRWKEIHILYGCNPQDLQSSPWVSFHLASWIKSAEGLKPPEPNNFKIRDFTTSTTRTEQKHQKGQQKPC